jgi:hypothetical protein
MRWLRILLTYVVMIGAMQLLWACESEGPIGNVPTTAYLPYIESVSFEDSYTEAEPVIVTLRFSAAMNPQVLNGLQAGEPPGGSWIWGCSERLQGSTRMRPWITAPLLSGPAATESVFRLGKHLPGTYQLFVETADSAEWGGLSGQYNAGLAWPDFPTHPHAVYREYTFTVLPAEE